MSEKKALIALEKVNKDYLELINSKEYVYGRRLLKLKAAIKNFKVRDLLRYVRSVSSQRRISNVSNGLSTHSADFHTYNYGDRRMDKKGVVYACITSGYDNPSTPIYDDECCDYILFTDDISRNSFWNEVNTSTLNLNEKGNYINRYCKMHPFALFAKSKYDYAVYVDGDVQLVSDVNSLYDIARLSRSGIAMHRHSQRDSVYDEAKACILGGRGSKEGIRRQISKYEDEGFPEHFGLCEATIIVVDLHNNMARKIMSDWWDEFCNTKSHRDQLAFPYVVWRSGLTMEDIGCLGNNLHYNPKFRIVGQDHKFRQ